MLMILSVFLYQNTLIEKDLLARLSKLPLLAQKRIMRHKRLQSRLNSLAGYLLLQHVLKEQEQSIDSLSFSKTGKPYLTNNSLSFSISHNANLVGLCLIPKEGKIGLDIQEYRSFAPIESAFSFFSKVEQQAILSSKTPNKTLIHYWSKKEALIKAGNGRMFDEATLTNTTTANCTWKGEEFHWKEIFTFFNGAIWVAANFPLQKISIKKCLSI